MSAALLAGCPKAPRYGADEPDADLVTDALGIAPADAGPTPEVPAIDRPSPDVIAPQDVLRDAGPPPPSADVTLSCPAPLQRCGSACRDLSTDPAHCGRCDNACVSGTACAGGACRCPAGQTACAGACRDLRRDNAHCGRCGNACAAGTICADGECDATCARGTTACDGVCRDLQNDPGHCGRCGRGCSFAHGVGGCRRGACALAACDTGYADCDGRDDNGCETDTATSAAHCGGCGRVCVVPNAQAGCAGGGCVVARCNEAYGDCDGNAANGCERNLGSDNLHCGSCGAPCPAGRVCSGGVCQLSCGTLAVCDGACRDTRVDPDHCGACGRACSAAGTAVRSCAAGQCNGACAPGRADCNNDLRADGCETDTGSTLASCGGCGMTCSTAHVTPACVGGECAGACEAGYADCNMNRRADGCETAISVDAHCGACGAACPTGQRCVRGDAGAPHCAM